MKYHWFRISFLHIHQHLCEVFGCNCDKPFAGKTLLVVGDLLQLPLVKSYLSLHLSIVHLEITFSLWELFQMCELTEDMR